MTEHTLRYTHEAKCPGEPRQKSETVKRRVKSVSVEEYKDR
jgi:hypothetical protein